MKTWIPAVVLLLVIVPTAILTFLAAESFRARELMLENRLDSAADHALRVVGQQVQAGLDTDLEQVSDAMARTAGAGELAMIRDAAVRVAGQREAVAQAYLYVHPWGFLHPADLPGEPVDPLVETIRRQLAVHPDGEILWFTDRGQAFGFRRIMSRRDLYAGFMVFSDALAKRLQTALEVAGADDFVLVAEGPGIAASSLLSRGAGDVLVSDSFSAEGSGENAFRSALREYIRSGRARAVRSLPPPYESVRLMAFTRMHGVPRQAPGSSGSGRWHESLHGWGISLLAVGVVIGVWIVLRAASLEIRKVSARSSFLVGISHDLRTPLASMKLLVESLYLGHVDDPAKRRRFLGTLLAECDRLGQLVERVLFMVRYGQDAVVLRLHPTDAGALVRHAVAAFRQARWPDTDPVAGDGADARMEPVFNVVVADNLPLVRIDETAITQILLNLLDNAVRYGRPPDGRLCIRVELATELRRGGWLAGRSRPWVRLSVSDNGPGMAGPVRRRVFRPYYRAPGVAQEHVSGVGLGLALCRHLVQAHGGRITVDSAPGRGTTFNVLLKV
ncbi:MAG: hypothetical protein A2498_14275 [Lentisphaerae bacterium RIFOXYC12_FULL_60_16]|nr:MAG: hypothetical protein A2498_14275 [Lentisphaerae bacterium RIFOXYC12_FULL_60_16]OGV79381.1 MAG: hypothetical protein A2340_04990 [Lentisphaerae bacterium RIFOXYB12_FULL_60_10]